MASEAKRRPEGLMQRWLARIAPASTVLLMVAGTVLLAAQPPMEGQSEFVPVSELPTTEQLPAAPLLIAAYAFVWLVLLVYLWSVGKRLTRVDSEVSRLERLIEQSDRERR